MILNNCSELLALVLILGPGKRSDKRLEGWQRRWSMMTLERRCQSVFVLLSLAAAFSMSGCVVQDSVQLKQVSQVRGKMKIRAKAHSSDLSRSFVEQGNGRYLFKPVAKVGVSEYVDQNPGGYSSFYKSFLLSQIHQELFPAWELHVKALEQETIDLGARDPIGRYGCFSLNL